MVKKIVNITLAQIIMWVVAFISDRLIEYGSSSVCFELIFYFILPVCLVVGYVVFWISKYTFNKSNSLIKWIIHYVGYLAIWMLETCGIIFNIYSVEVKNEVLYKKIIMNGYVYWWWTMIAIFIPLVVAIMHILLIVIKGEYNQR